MRKCHISLILNFNYNYTYLFHPHTKSLNAGPSNQSGSTRPSGLRSPTSFRIRLGSDIDIDIVSPLRALRIDDVSLRLLGLQISDTSLDDPEHERDDKHDAEHSNGVVHV